MIRGISPQPAQPQAGLRREINRRDAPSGQQARATSAISPSPPLGAHGEPRAASIAGLPTTSLAGPSGPQRRQAQQAQVDQRSWQHSSMAAGRLSTTGPQQAAALSTQDPNNRSRTLSTETLPTDNRPRGIQLGFVKKASSVQVRNLTGSTRLQAQAAADLAQVTHKSSGGSTAVPATSPSDTSSQKSGVVENQDDKPGFGDAPSMRSARRAATMPVQDFPNMLDALMHCHWDGAPPASPKSEEQISLSMPAWPKSEDQTHLHMPAWKDMMSGHARSPSPLPSEAPSSVSQSCMRSVVTEGAINLDRLSLEERVRRLENSLDEKLIKATSEAMGACVTLCKAAEDRFGQQLEALRLEVSQLQQATHSAQQAALLRASTDRIDRIDEEPQTSRIESLRSDLLQELHSTIGQEVSTLRFELAARGVPVTAGLPSAPDLEALTPLGFQGKADQPRKTGIAGLVGVISDCVIEKMKEDNCIKSAAEQHDQLKEVIEELRSLPSGPSSDNSCERKNELENLHSMVKEMVKISYSLAQEISSERQQRSRDFGEAQERLAAVEQGLPPGASAQCDRSLSASTRQRAAIAKRSPQGGSKMGTIGNGGSLERVIGGLQRLANQEDMQRPDPISPTQRSSSQTSGSPPPSARLRATSQGSQDESSSWSTEVRALRSRLENIFQIGGSQPDPLANTGSTVGTLSGTVGSLPTVPEVGAQELMEPSPS